MRPLFLFPVLRWRLDVRGVAVPAGRGPVPAGDPVQHAHRPGGPGAGAAGAGRRRAQGLRSLHRVTQDAGQKRGAQQRQGTAGSCTFPTNINVDKKVVRHQGSISAKHVDFGGIVRPSKGWFVNSCSITEFQRRKRRRTLLSQCCVCFSL